jgi:hypothetical protein
MARVKRWLVALGLLALLFAPGALVTGGHGDVGAAALAPTFSSGELARAPSPTPLPALPATTPLLVLVAGFVVLVALRPVDVALRPLPTTPVGRRGPPPRSS